MQELRSVALWETSRGQHVPGQALWSSQHHSRAVQAQTRVLNGLLGHARGCLDAFHTERRVKPCMKDSRAFPLPYLDVQRVLLSAHGVLRPRVQLLVGRHLAARDLGVFHRGHQTHYHFMGRSCCRRDISMRSTYTMVAQPQYRSGPGRRATTTCQPCVLAPRLNVQATLQMANFVHSHLIHPPYPSLALSPHNVALHQH